MPSDAPPNHTDASSTPEAALLNRYHALQARIEAAARHGHRDPSSITLLAVSKTVPAAAILRLAAYGQTAFGENYLQEAVPKITACAQACVDGSSERSDRPDEGVSANPAGRLVWHFIGPLQANKTRGIAEHFDWVQSVDQARLADRLARQRPAHLPPLQVCIQVNAGAEAGKRGCAPAEAAALAAHIAQLDRLRLRGLMLIPEADLHPSVLAARFAAGRALFEQLKRGGSAVDTLSMGMSDDLEPAVAEGATMVRVGSALFGPRASNAA